MINQDHIYNKHQNCEIKIYHVYSTYSQDMRYRCYCESHNKWLHTLSNPEAELLKQTIPDIFGKL